MLLEERYRQWADELVDLSGRNDLISFRQTKTSTLLPSEEAIERLFKEESLLLSDLIDLETAEDRKAASGVIKDAIELEEQFGIEVLKLVSGFASWKTDKVASPNAPFLLYSLVIDNPGASLAKVRLKLISTEPEVNPVFILHLKRRLNIDIDEEAVEEAEIEGAETVQKLITEKCPAEIGLEIKPGFSIKNMRYQKLPMVKDLISAVDSLSANTLIAALAGDNDSRSTLKRDIAETRQNAPDYVPPENEFLVLDADSSQEWAINSALKGQNLVIEGPPGTGKSQTIANLIASYMAVGKNVLFVAEKRAAIDAVKKRIELVGLSDCFLDLHSIETVRKRPADSFVKSLEEISNVPDFEFTDNQENLNSSRGKLVQRSEEIQKKREPWGCSYLETVQFAIKSLDAQGKNYSISPDEVSHIHSSKLDELDKCLQELVSLSAGKLLSRDSVISRGIKTGALKLPGDVQDLILSLDTLRSALKSVETWVASQEESVRDALVSCSDIKQAIKHIQAIKKNQTLDIARLVEVGDEALSHLIDVLKKNLLIRIIYFLVDSDYRKSLGKIKHSLQKGVKPSAVNLRSASHVVESQQYAESIGMNPLNADCPDELPECINRILKSISSLNRFINDLLGDDSPLSEIRETADNIEEQRLIIPNAPKVERFISQLKEIGLSELGLLQQAISDLCAEKPSAEINAKIVSAWAERVEELIRIQSPALASCTRDYLDQTVDEFRETDQRHIATTGHRIRKITADRANQICNQHPDQVELLKQQSVRRRKRMTARKIFTAAPEVVKALKPCWAMSPLVVSQLLPANEPFFDVVIFDEASQIVPFEAITSILRGKQTIVAGDSKQLSPTRTAFFSSSSDDENGVAPEDDDDTFDAVDEAESLLDAVKSVLPDVYGVRTLQWHYRSEDERLIAFSNQHPDLYGSRLITAPSQSEQAPFAYHQVEGDFKEITGRSPKAEIKRTVELAINHLKTKPELSLAVIAFGQEHARNIQNEFAKQVGENSRIPLCPEGKEDEKFVIRHLESIQGDERDVVFIATGYGPRKVGTLRKDFGPINRDKNFFGLRRLNVAVTRARKRVEVISTIKPFLYDDNQLNGVGLKGLIQYLRFVHSGGQDLGDLAKASVPMNPFEQDIHDALVARGIGLVPQYGVSGYRLDFAVQDPVQKGRFILAIEADGASYHSSETARDRDRIRQNHLERLGWKFHRIWSTEWFRNKEREIEIAIAAIEGAKDSNS